MIRLQYFVKMVIKEHGVMPRKFEEQNGLIKKQKLSWQSFRNGFLAGHAQAIEEYNVIEIIESLEQVVSTIENLKERDNIWWLDDPQIAFDLEKLKLDLKEAKREWK